LEKVQTEKGTRFFKYLLELNNLVAKVDRDYKDFEKSWETDTLENLEGCRILDDCINEDNFLEIERPKITEKEERPPQPPSKLRDWINGTISNENKEPVYYMERKKKNEEGEAESVSFKADPERVKQYKAWKEEWKEWADSLKEKKIVSELYNDFFHLVSRFEREGDTLEFIYGRGILTWKHSDRKIGTIRHPLITTKLELVLIPEKSLIVGKLIDESVKVERDMLSSVNLSNRQQLDEVIAEMQRRDIHEDFSDLFHRYVTLIHPDGEFNGNPEAKLNIKSTPLVYDQSIFSLRGKKVRVLRQDLEQIIKGVEGGSLEMTESVASIVDGGVTEETEATLQGEETTPLPKNHLYFPLPANEQQKDIVNRIDRNFGVTVQGPPGTGKTHTIANLVSHFLAQGKRILITSQKENALKVLKDKIPETIRDLCVPVLGGGRESMAGIERSIRTLSEKLGELDTDSLQKTIARNLKALDQSNREEARLTNELKTYAEKEGTPLTYQGEKLYKYDVAKKLSKTDIDYKWIKDDVKMDVVFPLKKDDWAELWGLRDRLSQQDLILYGKRLPKLDTEIMSTHSFNELVQEGDSLNDYEDEGKKIIETYQLKKDKESVLKVKESLQNILSHQSIINNSSSRMIVEDLKAGGVREERWRNLYTEQEKGVQKLFALYNDLITHEIQLPEKSLQEREEDVATAKEHLAAGKKPSMFFFMFKGKNTKYLFEDRVLNGNPVTKKEDLDIIGKNIQYEKMVEQTARILNGNMQEVNGSTVEKSSSRFPHDAEEVLAEVKTVIQYVDDVVEAEGHFPSDLAIDFYDFETVESVKEELNIAEKFISLNHWKIKQEEEVAKLREYSNERDMHPVIYEFIEAIEMNDKEKWSAAIEQLLTLGEKQKLVHRFYEILESFEEVLPATAAFLAASVGQDWEYIEDYKEALELRKLQTWLDETKDMNVARLKDKLEEEHQEQKRLISEVVTASTWNSQLERITQAEKRALSSWKSYIKRYGKGSGKSAQTNLKGARESMKTAQGAIPVWIMPINQVLENFPVTNDKFDVIIFDESSQCDLFSANVLLRGKKMIVVGDEEQISPQSIGIKHDDVNELVRRYLNDVPNANLFDGNISLYEIAEQTFPKEGKLMLREHFRCVPEIIQFSNDLSYGGEMIPLRLPVEDEKLEPPVTSVKIEDGHNNGGDKDLNEPEADRIVQDIEAIIEDPAYNDQTFGVIALQGKKQASLIETKIREAIGDEEFVRRKVICGDAYTLQGDERDVIFLSMVVAPKRNFRALTKNSEKQRINVAASRAKNQMRLYHSVDSNDLNPDDLRYQLLSYCKNPSRVNDEMKDLESECDSPFEVDVMRMILAKGYKVTPQVKVGRYRIDLVVEGMRNRLAVECDGEAWHGPEKFEEDMIRQESLERAGWVFWRVRGRDFYLDRKNALESLWEKLDRMGIEPRVEG